MSFDSLSHQYEFEIPDFPAEWVPLTHLYDPDLPLFPLMYFHRIDPDLAPTARPLARDRVYGYVKHLSYHDNRCTATVVTNKDLSDTRSRRFLGVVQEEVRARLGVQAPVTHSQISSAISGGAAAANQILNELWHQVVGGSFGGTLPYGNMWDGVFGLPRFIASWNSNGGRKGELIQTHAYISSFGEKVSNSSGGFVDFYLLPSFQELQDKSNPLAIFPRFARLIRAMESFALAYCEDLELPSGNIYKKFSMEKSGLAGGLDTKKLLTLFDRLPAPHRGALYDVYSAFNRGPPRAVLAVLMHCDLRNKGWNPRALTPVHCAEQYSSLKRTYQSPKVMQLYAQQCFGSNCALPIDSWVTTFMKWPLSLGLSEPHRAFDYSDFWGRVERLIWMSSQARKVHSSVAKDMLWCVRYGTPDKHLRGANPLSCKICLPHIRGACPAYREIDNEDVDFNNSSGGRFLVKTSAGDDSPGQIIISCAGPGVEDQYSPADRPNEFGLYPSAANPSPKMKVREFLASY